MNLQHDWQKNFGDYSFQVLNLEGDKVKKGKHLTCPVTS